MSRTANIQIVPGDAANDRDIARLLYTRFEDDLSLSGVDNLTFRVQNAHVVVSGQVTSAADERNIIRLTQDVMGVVAVTNNLERVNTSP